MRLSHKILPQVVVADMSLAVFSVLANLVVITAIRYSPK
jgi:hypothetical protein